MKHDWERQYRNEPADMLRDRYRRCRNCGAEQSRETHYLWMRVTGYRWAPLVGRCKPAPESPERELNIGRGDCPP